MKKLIYFVFFTAVMGSFIWACRNEQTVTPASIEKIEKLTSDIGVVNDMLAFSSVDKYETHLTKLKNMPTNISETEFLSKVEADLGFQSKRAFFANKMTAPSGRTLADDGIQDDHLASILNKDNMVQIDNWIFKLDLVQGKCFVLSVKDANSVLLEKLKSANPVDAKIKIYSTQDDVLDLLPQNKPSEFLASSGRVAGLFGTEDKAIYVPGTGTEFDCKVVYQAAAVYFSLQAKAKFRIVQEGAIFPPYLIPFKSATVCMDYYWKYKPKNRDENSSSSTFSTRTTCGGDPERSLAVNRVYEASRRLDKYCYSAVFRIVTSGAFQFSTPRTMGVVKSYTDCPDPL